MIGNSPRSRQQGLTYLFVLLSVAIMGVWLGSVGTLWGTASQREKEQALLDIGHEYRNAIKKYYEQTPGSIPRYPAKLSELLLDKRYLQVRRHMRKLYSDPIMTAESWGTIEAPDGGIMGVYSSSKLEPLKKAGFAVEDQAFNEAAHYSDWRFIYIPHD